MRWPFLLLLVVGTADAEVYRCDKGGRVVYTDQPCSENAEPKQLPQLNVVEPSELEKHLADEYDKQQAKEKKIRDKANQKWLKQHEAKTADAERLKKTRNQGKVVSGMSADQVRDIYGEPDSIKKSESAGISKERWTFHLNGVVQTVDLKDGRVTHRSEKKSKSKSKSK